jgi:hypothetical protein
LYLRAGFLPVLDHFQIRHRPFRKGDARVRMRNGAAILIHDKNYRQASVKHLPLAF